MEPPQLLWTTSFSIFLLFSLCQLPLVQSFNSTKKNMIPQSLATLSSIYWWEPLEISIYQAENSHLCQLVPPWQVLHDLHHLCGPASYIVLWTSFSTAEHRRITCISSLAMLLLTRSRRLLTFVIRTQFQLMISLAFTKISMSFSEATSHSLSWCLKLFLPKDSVVIFLLLNFMRFLSAHFYTHQVCSKQKDSSYESDSFPKFLPSTSDCWHKFRC